ncbi:hypothetical protein F4802DRAFT_599315 [Xylaria palmicola]|nr:hypothetical protein F4802DRAFT_599315 [Xylaria palmicola]
MDRLKMLRNRGVGASHRKNRRARKQRGWDVIKLHTQETYTCQLSLLILLHSRSYGSLRPVRQHDAERIIEFDLAHMPRNSFGMRFDGLLDSLSCEDTIAAQLPYLDALEASLVDALHLLHSRNISFPISARYITFWRRRDEDRGDMKSTKLFLPFNKHARWGSDKWPPTWKAEDLARARSIFFIPKLLARLSTSAKPTLLDPATQQSLATYLKEHSIHRHDKYCMGIAPLTPRLAYQIAKSLVKRGETEKCREVLESFFGGPLPLPEPGTSPGGIYKTFMDLRACAVESERHGSATWDRDLEPKLLMDSPTMVLRFVLCRAKVASLRGDPDTEHWRRAASVLAELVPHAILAWPGDREKPVLPT